MAFIKVGRSQRRPQSLRGKAALAVKNGKLVAQAWPRPRGTSKWTYQAAQVRRIRWLQKNVYNVSVNERGTMQRALAKFMDKTRGVRATAAIRERDFLTSNFAGRLFRPEVPPGRPLNPAAVHGDASDIMDWLEPRIGSMVVRTSEGWLPTVNCKPGAILMMTNSSQTFGCCPNASIPPAHLAMGGHLE